MHKLPIPTYTMTRANVAISKFDEGTNMVIAENLMITKECLQDRIHYISITNAKANKQVQEMERIGTRNTGRTRKAESSENKRIRPI